MLSWLILKINFWLGTADGLALPLSAELIHTLVHTRADVCLVTGCGGGKTTASITAAEMLF